MSFLTQFPYTNLHELNLDWIIKVVKELEQKVDESVTSKIKVADPLQWDITKQYEAYTIVMDNGNAYLSIQAVPYGTDIGNEDYWQMIFNVGDIFTSIKSAISVHDDGDSTVSSAARDVGSLVWLNESLYRVIAQIAMGDSYTDQNIESISIEDIIDDILAQLATMETYVKNRLWGKTIAIYGDSWVTDNWSAPWMTRLQNMVGMSSPIHHVGIGSASMAQVYSGCWDNYVADIYIIMAGLNDVGLNTGGQDFMDALSGFATAIHTTNPDAEVYFVTAPKIDRNDFKQKRLPPEFYRTCIWRFANIYKYHVINGLKWVDLKYFDNVHPNAATAPYIADYLFESLLNFGDEETHIKEFCTMTRTDDQIYFEMDAGLAYLVFQNTVFTPIAVDGSSGIVLNIGYNLNYNQISCYGKPNGGSNQPCMIVTGIFAGNSQAVMLCPPLAGQGYTSFTIAYTAKLNLPINAWNIPVTA